jgi:vitamin B12 transporter
VCSSPAFKYRHWVGPAARLMPPGKAFEGCSTSPDTGQHSDAAARVAVSLRPSTGGEPGADSHLGCFFMFSSFYVPSRAPAALRLSVLSAAVLAAGGSGHSLAQTASTLSETVVTATRSSQLLTATMPHTTVITRDDIERSQAPDLISLLQREAGLQPTQNGGMGTVSGVFLRGAPSLQTLVLVDGIPINKQDASGTVSLEHLMLDNIERVEVVRGNVSAVYGSGAIGGVIQVFTRGSDAAPSARVAADAGPRGYLKLSTQLSTQVGANRLSVGVSRQGTDGFSAVNPAQQVGANPDADAYANTSAHFGWIHEWAPQHRLGMRLSQSTGKTDYDNAFGAPSDIQTSRTRLRLAHVYADNTWGDWRSRVSLGTQGDKGRYSDNGQYGSVDSYHTATTVLSWVNYIALGDGWLATLGLERQRQAITTDTTSAFGTPYDSHRHTDAWFGGMEGDVGAGRVQVNARRDTVGDLAATTTYLGYSHPVNDRWTLTASASDAFNAPPLGYLYGPGFGNPLLQPERARSRELGAQFLHQGQALRATYFHTRVRDQLEYDTASFQFANIGRVRNEGLELSYKGQLGATRLRASLTLQDPVNESTGQSLVRRGKTLWSAGASHTVGPAALDAHVRHSGARPDRYTDPASFQSVDTALVSYQVLDVAVAYTLSPQLQLRARIDNLTNRRYQTVYSYNQQARSVYAGVTWRPTR